MDALDRLKNELVHQDQWRENGNYIEKPPFPKPQTEVRFQKLQRDDDTGEVTLRLTPVSGDTVHYEIGAQATPASAKVSDPKQFKTGELVVSFLCVDSKGEYDTGAAVSWQNCITIKSRTYQSGTDKMVELRTAPAAPLRYTTDGSDPKLCGATYDGPFVVSPGTLVVLAVAEKHGIVSDCHRLNINWDGGGPEPIKTDKPAIWKREHAPKTTQETYEFLGRLRKYQASVPGPRVDIAGQHWLELTCDDHLALKADQLEGVINHLRGLLSEGQVAVEARALHFLTGQQLLDWVADVRTELKPEEVEQ
jgi:hypothetical protein